jgi:hypothetical protein
VVVGVNGLLGSELSSEHLNSTIGDDLHKSARQRSPSALSHGRLSLTSLTFMLV